MVKLQTLNLQLCRKINSTKIIFKLICYLLRTPVYPRNLKETSKNFEMKCVLSCSRCIALHFQLLQLAVLQTFYQTRMNHLNEQHLLSNVTNEKVRKVWKV